MKDRVMVIEDERKIADAIGYALKREGYLIEIVYNGEEAIDKILHFKPDALILDVMLPGMDGYDILKRLDDRGHMGVIMLTAKEDIVNKILGLELGADDYMTKPFDMRELLARLKSLLRRMQKTIEPIEKKEVRLGKILLYLDRRTAFVEDRMLDLTPKEYDLLTLFVANPDRVYSRDNLLDLIWGMEYIGGTRTVDIHVQRLRKKMGETFGEMIQTIHGVGYKAVGTYYEH